jgi:hypothetical protein
MKGFLTKTLAALCVGGGLAAAGGCYTYPDLVDPCYPDRYNFAARQEVAASFAPQMANGHVLDQTVWNYHFEEGTDRLTPGGLEHLAYLARRRPSPDPHLFLQTAQDLHYDPDAPDQFVKARVDLDQKRKIAVEKYLATQTAGRPVVFEVSIHDPADVSASAIGLNIAVQQMYTGFRGILPVGGGINSRN